MKADCKYCRNSKCCAHNTLNEHICAPSLHWIVQSWTPNMQTSGFAGPESYPHQKPGPSALPLSLEKQGTQRKMRHCACSKETNC